MSELSTDGSRERQLLLSSSSVGSKAWRTKILSAEIGERQLGPAKGVYGMRRRSLNRLTGFLVPFILVRILWVLDERTMEYVENAFPTEGVTACGHDSICERIHAHGALLAFNSGIGRL